MHKQFISPVSYKNEIILKHNDNQILRSYHIILTSCSNSYQLFPKKLFECYSQITYQFKIPFVISSIKDNEYVA